MTEETTTGATRTDRYGVMGYPVSHSRSPIIHRLFATQTGEDIQYELLQVTPEKLETAVRQFQRTGGKGLNITVPHKGEVTRLVDQMSERATTAGAVNTLTFQDGKVLGDNTDGIGLQQFSHHSPTVRYADRGRHSVRTVAGHTGKTRDRRAPVSAYRRQRS